MIIGRYKIEHEDRHNVKLSKFQEIKGKKGTREDYVFIGYYGSVGSAFDKMIKDEEMDLLDKTTLDDFLKEYKSITNKYIEELKKLKYKK